MGELSLLRVQYQSLFLPLLLLITALCYQWIKKVYYLINAYKCNVLESSISISSHCCKSRVTQDNIHEISLSLRFNSVAAIMYLQCTSLISTCWLDWQGEGSFILINVIEDRRPKPFRFHPCHVGCERRPMSRALAFVLILHLFSPHSLTVCSCLYQGSI